MRKLKEVLVLLLIAAILSMSLMGCKGKSDQPPADNPSAGTPADSAPADNNAPSPEHPTS